ncbi:MAG: phosphodiesterase class-II:metallo-beta-lactamase-like protein [Chloroflexi bacterium]|nr:phosphodiesterase class-II:metallo-beta-lactamase-like protein [Chloroflexota bacterium]
MHVRILGAHNLETHDTRHTCFLIDGVLGVDAGSTASALTAAEQHNLAAILVTHAHYDHIRDLPTLGLVALDDDRAMDVHGLAATLDSVHAHLMDGRIYPDFTRPVGGAPPICSIHPHEVGATFQVAGYDVGAVPAQHSIPAVGYIIRSPSGESVAYSGDTGGGLLPFFEDAWQPRILFVEMTLPNRLEWRARLSGHLTPALLKAELDAAMERRLSLPRIVAVHVGFSQRDEITRELAEVSQALGVEIVRGIEDMSFDVDP